jgi:hypothetical protein
VQADWAEIRGEFWRFDTPERREPGVIKLQRGHTPLLDLERPVVDQTVDIVTMSQFGGITIRPGTPDEVVAALQPVTLHGELEEGVQVSLLEARGRTHPDKGAPRQRYEAQYMVEGAHVTREQTYRNVRLRLSLPASWRHVAAGQSVRLADGSVLSVVEDESQRWLDYRSAEPLRLRSMASKIVAGCQVLASLAFKEHDEDDVTVLATQLQIDDGDPWLRVVSRNLYANIPDEFSPLLTTDELTLDRVAKWLPLHETLDDLDWAVAEPPTGPIQTSLLARASVAEGVHRRLFPESRRFDLTKGALKNIREELRDRGTELFRQHGIDDKTRTDKCISDALNYMNDISFRDRVDEMVAVVNNVAPIVLAAIPDSSRQLVRARNDLAHYGESHNTESFEAKIDRWTVFYLAIPWMLRVILLERAGVEPETLRNALDESMAFAYYRATIKSIVDDLGWSSGT